MKTMTKLTIALDSSQIVELQTCPLRWYYKYKENLELCAERPRFEPADDKTSVSLDGVGKAKRLIPPDKGTLVHNLLDIYYNLRANDPNSALLKHSIAAIEFFKRSKTTECLFPDGIWEERASKKEGIKRTQITPSELETFICERFNQYVFRWMNEDFKIPVVDDLPGVEIGFSKILYENSEVRFIVEGRIDLVTDFQGRRAWVDHKTQERFSNLYKYKPQFKTYAWALGSDYGLVNYFGLTKEYKDGQTFRRDLIYFTPQMIIEWEIKMLSIFEKVRKLIEIHDACVNLMNIHIDMERATYELRNDSACGGAFDSNPCAYTHLCEEFNWDMKQRIKEFKYRTISPWAPWRLIEPDRALKVEDK